MKSAIVLLIVATFCLVSSCTKDPHNMVLIEGRGDLEPFYLSRFETTQAEFERVMGFNPSRLKSENRPVEYLTIWNVLRYLNRLSELENREPAYLLDPNESKITWLPQANGYRLPTIEEWLFAKKGGNKSMGFMYAGSNNLDPVAWYEANSEGHPHDVGTKLPNELDIYDMTGNVWEFCLDPETIRPGINPITFPAKGGGWSGLASDMDDSITTYFPDTYIHSMLGFRLARNVDK